MTPEEQGLPCYYVIEMRDELGVNDRGIHYGKQRPQCIYRKEENRKQISWQSQVFLWVSLGY